jgi:hypothetical protein
MTRPSAFCGENIIERVALAAAGAIAASCRGILKRRYAHQKNNYLSSGARGLYTANNGQMKKKQQEAARLILNGGPFA